MKTKHRGDKISTIRISSTGQEKSLMMECNQCDSTENTKQFTYFGNKSDEILCWECRYPIIKDRLDDTENDIDEEELSGQTGLGDW